MIDNNWLKEDEKEVGEEKDGEVKGEGEHAARVKESTVSDAHFRCHKGDKG